MIRLSVLGQGKDSSSDNSSVYKHGQADGSCVKTNYVEFVCSDELACVARLA